METSKAEEARGDYPPQATSLSRVQGLLCLGFEAVRFPPFVFLLLPLSLVVTEVPLIFYPLFLGLVPNADGSWTKIINYWQSGQ